MVQVNLMISYDKYMQVMNPIIIVNNDIAFFLREGE